MVNIPVEARFVLDKLNYNGFSAYVVGGCVRDSILLEMGKNVTVKDWDIATNAKPEQIKDIFDKTVDTGIKHGTVTVIVDKKSFEVTTYRVDGEYEDCRHPKEVNFTDNLLQDLSRRDFTVNSIAYNDEVGYVDIFGGMDDIRNGVIRCVGEPAKRFNEDALRMMRALRFANQLDFDIDSGTYKVLKENISLIRFISVERIRDELLKLFCASNEDKLYLLDDSDILRFVNEKFWVYWRLNHRYVSKLLLKADKACDTLMCVVLSGLDACVAYDLARFFRFSNKVCDTVKLILDYLDCDLDVEEYFVKKIVSEIGFEDFCKVLRIRKILKGEDGKALYDLINKVSFDCVSSENLAINGDNVKDFGFQGSEIGFVLRYLLDFVHRFPERNIHSSLSAIAKSLREF